VSSRGGSLETRRSFYRLTITSQPAGAAKEIVPGLLIQIMSDKLHNNWELIFTIYSKLKDETKKDII